MYKNLTIVFISFFILCSCDNKKDLKTSSQNGYDSIRLVSYNTARFEEDLKFDKGTFRIENITFIDDIILDEAHSKKIFSIISSKSNTCTLADCYNPRHILMFYKQKRIIGFYEFCVGCGGSNKSGNVNLKPICKEQGDELIKVFKLLKLKNNGEETESYKYF